jgi:hypothetical protein
VAGVTPTIVKCMWVSRIERSPVTSPTCRSNFLNVWQWPEESDPLASRARAAVEESDRLI